MSNLVLTLAGTASTPKLPVIGESLNKTFHHAYDIPAGSVSIPLYFGLSFKIGEDGKGGHVELDELGNKLFEGTVNLGFSKTFDTTIDGIHLHGSATLAESA